MNELEFAAVSPCDYADGLPREQFMHYHIKPLWHKIPRIAGPAFTVKCAPGDHLMLHAAIYEAKPGDIIVCQADEKFAVSGGNVCAIAQKRGIAGFVIDGVVRDIEEVRDIQFPIFARGVCPKPGAKKVKEPLNQTIQCGGVTVHPGDIVVADEEGIAVLPKALAAEVYEIGKKRRDKDAALSLEQWQANHEQLIKDKLASL
ncbi:RraA family protein [Planctobacterium marinum]|uniref:RraA family protein n=1 Tax=Planctobacterium marinum TaxID=1631968 RepID=UPI001E58686B|nr:RraA family protein [Planctobacterium marinum]MCC2607174.1 RraA family protein [Planctobacterium marinum]